MVHPPEQHSPEQVSNPLSGQILEFCESELFPETLQISEVASSSNNCCYEEQSSYTTALSFAPDVIKYSGPMTTNSPTTAVTAATTTNNTTNFSLVFDSNEEITENDIAASIDFSTSPHFTLPHYTYNLNHQEQYDLSLLQSQIPLTDHNDTDGSLSQYTNSHSHQNDHVVPIMPPPLPPVCEDECLSSMPPSKYMRLKPPSPLNCSYVDPPINSFLVGNMNAALSAENSGIFNGSLFLGNEIQHQEFEFQGDNGGIFCPEAPPPRGYNSSENQALSNESQHLVNGGGSSATHLASEITSLEADTFRVTTKLTAEERREKIHRYMKKRNERNFSKKIKYACRKTLADSRPRVRGRFAKNDEFGDATRTTCITHEEDTDEDVKPFHVVVKQEEENFDSSDIFAHISGVNSFKCNYPIQSWI